MTIAEIRSSLGLTVSEVARACGIPEATWWNWEKGRRNPTGLYRVLVDALSEIAQQPGPHNVAAIKAAIYAKLMGKSASKE